MFQGARLVVDAAIKFLLDCGGSAVWAWIEQSQRTLRRGRPLNDCPLPVSPWLQVLSPLSHEHNSSPAPFPSRDRLCLARRESADARFSSSTLDRQVSRQWNEVWRAMLPDCSAT